MNYITILSTILIPFGAKILARYSLLKFKPFNCDLCLTFWITLIFLYTESNLSYLYIGLYSLVNAYWCVLFGQIKNKILGYAD